MRPKGGGGLHSSELVRKLNAAQISAPEPRSASSRRLLVIIKMCDCEVQTRERNFSLRDDGSQSFASKQRTSCTMHGK